MNDLPAPPAFDLAQELAAFDAQHADPNPPDSQTPAERVLLRNDPDTSGEAGDLTKANSVDAYSNPVFDSFASSMQTAGVPIERMADARSWLDTLQGDIGDPEIAHGYDVHTHWDSFSEDDKPILTSFLNHAARSGWDQSDVDNAIAWYLDAFSDTGPSPEDVREALQAERDIESLDKQDRDRARDVLREHWAEEADANRVLINQHLDRLPSSEREFYEGADSDGRLRLNNPETLDRLARDARQQIPPVLVEAARQHGGEKAALEAMMADRSSAYWKGGDNVALQSRYRDLLRAGDTGSEKPLPTGSHIAAELSEIEHVMRTNFHRYRKDEAMQQRYRQLLELTGG